MAELVSSFSAGAFDLLIRACLKYNHNVSSDLNDSLYATGIKSRSV